MSEAKVEATEPAPDPTTEEVTTKANDESTAPAEKKDEVKDNGNSETKQSEEKRSETNGYERNDFRGAKRHFKKPNNNKFDPSTMPVTDDPVAIRAQVEFYFGDANLPTDAHLWEKTDGSANKPVSIKLIHDFKRMRRFQPYEAIVAALRDSKFLKVEGEGGQEKVSRKEAYNPQQPSSEREARSVYVKGFGEEKPTTQFDIEAFFAEYGTTNAVRLRRSDDRLFKGSVFVEFADEETAQKFLNLDPKPLWQGKDELKVMSKRDYVEEKNQLIKDGKMEPREFKPRHHRGRNDFHHGGRGRDRDGRDPDDWKRRRDEDQKSGFRNDRRDYRNGGRGRGRGGHRDRDDRDDRDDRRSEANAPEEQEQKEDEQKPDEPKQKREREDDEAAADETPAKKVDTKEEVATES